MMLSGHRAVVIGAGGALGTAVCVAYAELGATVHAFDLDPEASVRSVIACPEGLAGVIDVRSPASVEAAVRAASGNGPIDSVVYAAGVNATAEVASQTADGWRAVMAVNLDGAFLCASAFTRVMLRAARPACLTFLASTAGLRAEAGAAAYCASKFGLLGLVRCLALEVAAAGLRVNAVCPGDVASPMLDAVAAAQALRSGIDASQQLAAYAQAIPRGRLIAPAEVAQAVAWLATPGASAITGAVLPIDGGTTAA